MDHRCQDDGWDNHNQLQEEYLTHQSPALLRYKNRDDALELLDNSHSLEPDMVFGWRPKLPSCPLPFSFSNPYADSLLSHIPKDDRFKIIYLGPRHSNSVQLNQQFDYVWKYRTRYSSNIGAVRQAVNRVGESNKRVKWDIDSSEITFDAAFESGNLDMAVRIKKNQYDLFLRSDTNTRGHTAWFYFKAHNRDLLGEVQFNICNFGKRKNLYAQGLKPYCSVDGNEWKQEGAYEAIWVERLCRYGFDRKTNQLQFKYSFQQKNQTVYFAYAIPYTFTKLQNFIIDITLKHSRYVKVGKLCQSLGGLDIPLLTITNAPFGQQNSDDNINFSEQIRKKKIVLITGRIHPGQSHSSYVLEGFIKSLLTQQPASLALRNSFIFYIVPMLNPDGVIAGNFRTSFSGKDLNRQFNKLNKYVFPQITALHDLAMQLKRTHRSAFQFYFDFHAHSSKKGLFCYGPQHGLGKPQFFRARALAKIIQQKNPIFSYRKSIFTISEHKKDTGRAHMLWKVKIPMTFTFQISNGLYQTKDNKSCSLLKSHMLELGNSVMLGLHRYGQLEMRLPSIKISAKVDTGIIKKRSGLSAKQFRKSTSKKGKTLTVKDMHQLKDVSNTHSLRQKNQISLQDILDDQKSQLHRYENSEDKQEFLRILHQIKKQQNQNKIVEQYEGDSDSQSEGEDLEEDQLAKLHKVIQTRNDNSKSYSKVSLSWKTHQRKDKNVNRKNSTSQEMKETINEEVPKKQVTSKYLQNIRGFGLPPRSKRLPPLQSQKIEKVVLAAKTFALQI